MRIPGKTFRRAFPYLRYCCGVALGQGMSGGERDLSRLHSVITRRSRIQDLAWDLLSLLDLHRSVRALDRPESRNPYDLLVGALFSLWRAIFLAEATEDWNAVLNNAETFLEKVIRNNAIGYIDDWNNRKWSFLYYLNNARFRLLEFAEVFPEFEKALRQSYLLLAQEGPVAANPFHSWDATCE